MSAQDAIRRIATLIQQSNNVIAFTGAGISTPSGIPDFRSQESGMWEAVDPLQVATLSGFRHNPAHFYQWVHPLLACILQAIPNAAHQALTTLEKQGKLSTIITQNIDMLHSKAGNHQVCELHGHLRTMTCIHCFAKYDAIPIMEQFLHDANIPMCKNCQSVLKPDIILFGEQLPYEALRKAKQASRHTDLIMVIGSSLNVAPADELPVLAKRNGAKLVIINQEMTHLDTLADVFVHDDAAVILPAILHEMEIGS